MNALAVKQNNKRLVMGLHLAAWIMYGGLMNFTHRLVATGVTITDTISSVLPYAVAFYVSYACLRLLKAKKFSVGVLVFFIVFVVLALLAYVYFYWLMPGAGVVLYTSDDMGQFMSQAIWGFIYMFGAAAIYYIVPLLLQRDRELLQKERELRQAENEKLQQQLEIASLREKELKAQKEKLLFENAFIRAQINPHFLHNTLNALVSDAYAFSEPLANNIRDLAAIMEYAMSSTNFDNDKVPVSKELKMLNCMLGIHRLRFPVKDTVKLHIDGKPGMQMVPPMTLLTLVENALKYGELKNPATPVSIQVVLRAGFIKFTCYNAKRKAAGRQTEHKSNQIGLNNIRYRLDEAFKNRYTLTIQDTEDDYTVELLIVDAGTAQLIS